MVGDEDASGPKGVMTAPCCAWGALATELLTFKWSMLYYVTSTPFQKQRRQTVHDRKRSHLAHERLSWRMEQRQEAGATAWTRLENGARRAVQGRTRHRGQLG